MKKIFFPGDPCRKGHTAERNRYGCTECRRIYNRERYWKDVEANRAYLKERYWKDPEGHRLYANEWYKNNLEKARSYRRKWREQCHGL